jgi:acetyl esterase
VGAQVVVVSVNYRLAPEHRFPAHLDDMEAAYRWVLATPQLDPTRIAVGGDSAGGNLAAALVVRLTRRADVPLQHRPRLQALVYPSLDFTCAGESHRKFADGFGLTADSIEFFVREYLGPGGEGLKTHPEASPLLYEDPSIFPPTLCITAEVDPLADDSSAFVAKLQERGTFARQIVYPGIVHAFITYFDIFEESHQAVGAIVDFLTERLVAADGVKTTSP